MSDEETERWAAVGKMLMQFRLEEAGGEVARDFRQVAGQVERGEEVGDNDVQRLYESLETAEKLVDELARVVEEGEDEE